ncbi:hypothetical protein AC578_3942 [Pseudocercospora eumusae]|uniref:Amino acid permease/ SLC12A domain-containing protein n=1 Tax=Pseudocercospora eumusae TaxID=321146 RepID=A0A139HLX5_9PEZI|nr:hypothetical protein AC578_3942 [Pseudocercospora eumusae]
MATTAGDFQDDRSPLLSSTSSAIPQYKTIENVERHEYEQDAAPFAPADVEADVLPETSILGRNLSWNGAYILTISRVLGSGIFATPGIILAAVGSPGLSLALWVVGAILAYFGMAIMLEYGCMLPRSGGEKVYLEFTYRKPKYLVTILMATQAILFGLTASNCIVFAQYTLFALGVEGTELVRKTLALALLTAITVMHTCFMKTGIRIQNFLGWIKIVLIVFMISSGLFVVLFRRDQRSTENVHLEKPSTDSLDWTWHGFWAGSIWSWGAIATSILKVFYSFAGLNNVNNVLNEVKDPVRTLKSVAITTLTTACGLYLLVNIAYFSVVPLEEIKTSGELVAALFFERVFGDAVGRQILPIMVAISAAGNVMVVVFAYARLKQELARTGLMPFSRFLSSNAPFGSPIGGLIIHYIPTALILTIPHGDVYSFVLEAEGYIGQLLSILIAIGLLRLRWERPDLERPYKAWLPGVLIRLLVAFALVLAPFFPSEAQRAKGILGSAAYALIGISVLTFGIVYWYIYTIAWPRWRGHRLEDKTETLHDGTTITRIAHIPI